MTQYYVVGDGSVPKRALTAYSRRCPDRQLTSNVAQWPGRPVGSSRSVLRPIIARHAHATSRHAADRDTSAEHPGRHRIGRNAHPAPRALLVVGGLPGAGKTTFLRRAVRDEEAIVLDSDRVRRRYRMLLGDGAPYALFRPLVHIEHYVRIWWALRAHRPLVVHECATRSLVRRWLARGAIRHGRSAHLLLIDVSPDVAYARQIARRRVVRRRSMRGHVRRWRRLRRQLDSRAGRLTIAGEGYTTIRLLTSAAAEALGDLRFDSAPNALSTRPEAAASVGTG